MAQFKFQHLRELFFGGKTFCCCLPVRLGAILLSLLGILFAGLLAIVLWFEVANNGSLTSTERDAFIGVGIVETFLLVACIIGFIGAVARKQLFVQIYAYFLYFHLVLNIAVAIYLLSVVDQFSTAAAYHACIDAIKDSQTQQQCIGFLQVARWVYFFVSTVLILIEIYAAMIVARYVNQIQGEKRVSRAIRTVRAEEYTYRMNKLHPRNTSYTALEDHEPLKSPGKGFGQPFSPGLSRKWTSDNQSDFNPYDEVDFVNQPSSLSFPPSAPLGMPPEYAGYAGGSLTHEYFTTKLNASKDDHEALDEPPRADPSLPLHDDQLPKYSS